MALRNSTMTYDQLGNLTAHLLHKAFIEATRTVSKGVFRRLVDGEVVPVTQLEFEGNESAQLNMRLHLAAYRGDINYTRFRDGVVALLQELLKVLSKEGTLKTLTANDPTGLATNTRLLGVSGPTQHGEDVNVLMVAITPSQSEPKILVELMYMDPDQFVSAKGGES